jgi:hypothetical protein
MRLTVDSNLEPASEDSLGPLISICCSQRLKESSVLRWLDGEMRVYTAMTKVSSFCVASEAREARTTAEVVSTHNVSSWQDQQVPARVRYPDSDSDLVIGLKQTDLQPSATPLARQHRRE